MGGSFGGAAGASKTKGGETNNPEHSVKHGKPAAAHYRAHIDCRGDTCGRGRPYSDAEKATQAAALDAGARSENTESEITTILRSLYGADGKLRIDPLRAVRLVIIKRLDDRAVRADCRHICGDTGEGKLANDCDSLILRASGGNEPDEVKVTGLAEIMKSIGNTSANGG